MINKHDKEIIRSEEGIADHYYYDKIKKLLLCDPPNDPDIINIYLLNRFSGYGDLVEKILKIIKNRKFKGNPVPLTIINGCYYSLCKREIGDIDMDKDIDKMKAAIFQAWKIKNPGENPQIFDDIFS